ncbi:MULTISPECIES: hypothetical protein [unclassified Undibacterium]|uniref:hypothetical protein n=1 Tax=unclassified Undibacterium TaxID=2630295 RepID=UPI002AC89B69|nr:MULTISPECIES: hypothetical protein [unclassified Undibacterium]MEB0137778.1 hypothetical protein [Undibacterium sp. CCC2.1]MEB0171031.1 hypothetical protein [Undibacterium sp. CCC1.1]MEB0175076.1 hypothetical protein [Undibacterium sp. CCC3.4]MEB0215146.1 hypothetical protein [Undibacterium sp. 5I2]WPX44880.1 hypothetical protein RHM61_06525 [Undibacterium sp. CCC3.4]
MIYTRLNKDGQSRRTTNSNPNNKKPDRLMHTGGSGNILLAAFIRRPQSESQIGAIRRKLYVKSRAWVVGCELWPYFPYTLWLDRYAASAWPLTKKEPISIARDRPKGN